MTLTYPYGILCTAAWQFIMWQAALGTLEVLILTYWSGEYFDFTFDYFGFTSFCSVLAIVTKKKSEKGELFNITVVNDPELN